MTNSGDSAVESDSQIVIEFSMTILNDSEVGFSDTDLRWITAGVEFANGMLIWVGQLGYYLQAADPPVSHNETRDTRQSCGDFRRQNGNLLAYF